MSFGSSKHHVKTGLFSVIVFISLQAAISAPLFVVEKAIGLQRMTVIITCSQVPELKSATFTCSYAIPKASLMEAIVSSPQPGTALSVLVDSATSTLSVTIQAATTLTPAENARIVMLKIPLSATFKAADFAITSAAIVNKGGTSATVAINNTLSGIKSSFPVFTASRRQRTVGTTAMYRIDGRKVPFTLQKTTCGLSIVQQVNTRIASVISVR